MNAAPDIEVADDGHRLWPARLHQVIEDLIDHRLVKRPLITVGPEIKFERFEFYAELCGHVADTDRGEVGLARARANAGKLRTFHVDLIVSSGTRIGKGFQLFTRPCYHWLILTQRRKNSNSRT